ncbi:O-antigen ligase family protein [Polynucleobacter sp. JS-Safj-400b-B2]|uniref:O-antigen ligase family protein n=1 Tax=Polynucleobacter sp. JS-Safj-400b-B2 TaxID=2576921 RepID=UPI001C0DE6DB|nr:O-antigen ligase family protein [Polynucleobacter sp. JS-Safj-400b-B2]MBU3625114.1 O-antigen ligase family protein [Polynucleobacter sp. JS-Safj-400b-B2]
MKITEKQLATASVASIVGLLFIWVAPNTIALRHVLLVAGCLSAIGLIRYNWDILKIAGSRLLPLLCIGSLFFWVLIHYTFFSLNPELELSEIKGLWMRSLLGSVAAVGLGIAIMNDSRLRLYLYIALFFTPFINMASYCWASYLNHGLVKPNDFVRFLFTKIETAYFGAIAAAVATGNLILLMRGRIDKAKTVQIVLWLLGLVLVLVSALVSSTKNGIAIALALCVLLAIVVVINSILHRGGSKMLSCAILVVIVVLSAGIWEGHKSLASRGWDSVFQDAALGLDIDTNKQWQKREGSVPAPLNSRGVEAALNTYSRFAYAAVGIRLISQYPLGYGSINRSFNGLQDQAQIPHEHVGQVHSGWIDFGLAFGIPGLVLIFSSMFSIIYFGLKSKSSVVLPWVIVCLAFIPFGLIAEITWKQYFEATLFFMTLSATMVALAPVVSPKLRR